MRDPLFLSQLAFVAFTGGVVAAVVLHKFVRNPRFPIAALLVSHGVLPAVLGLAWATGVFADAATVWLGRLSNLLIILALLVALLTGRSQQGGGTQAGQGLIVGVVAFALLSLLSEFAMGGTSGAGRYMLASFIAIWLARTPSSWLLQQLKLILAVYVVGSALVALLAPFAWVPYGGLIGIDIRVHGLAPHANSLGPLMLLYLIMEYAQPSRVWVRWGVGGTATVLLVLAQSKTTWAAAIVVGVLLWSGRSPRGAATRLIATGMIAVTCVALIVLTTEAAEYESPSEQVTVPGTLTGRTVLWAYAVDVWRESPIFGGGPAVFRDYAERTGQAWAGHAHNQFIQSLSRHGVVGLMGLLAYLGALIYYGSRLRGPTQYVSVALVATLLVRTVTEANLSSFTLEQFVVFGMLLAWERDHDSSAPLEQDAAMPTSRLDGV